MREPTTRRILIEQAEQRRKDKVVRWAKWLRITEDHLRDGFGSAEIAQRLRVSRETVNELMKAVRRGKP